MPELTPKQVARVQGALLACKDAIETLAKDEEMLPELVRGIVIGVFLGIPQQIKRALAELEEDLAESEQESAEA